MENLEETITDTNKDIEFHRKWNQTLAESWHNCFEGINGRKENEICYKEAGKQYEEHIIKMCSLFEKKFKKKLKYEFRGDSCYLRY